MPENPEDFDWVEEGSRQLLDKPEMTKRMLHDLRNRTLFTGEGAPRNITLALIGIALRVIP